MFYNPYSRLSIASLTALAVAMGSVSAASYLSFPGSRGLVLLFTTLSFLNVAVVWLLNRSAYCFLLCSFLFLGLWAKFIAHFALGVSFIEPMGHFDESAEAWDMALLVASAGLGGVIAGTLGANWALPRYGRSPIPAESALLSRFGLHLLGIGGVIATVLFIVNFHFAILKMGFVPRIEVHPYISVAVSFVVSWGALLGLLAVTFWLITAKRLPATAIFYVGSLEGALAALSMGSRVQMILHVLAAAITYLYGRSLGWGITLRGWIKVISLTALLFVVSLAGVSLDRAVSFASATPIPQDAPSLQDNPAPPQTPSPAVESRSQAQDQREVPPPSLPAPALETSIAHRIAFIPHEISRLFVMRWVGLEGILSAVGSSPQLGMGLFWDGVFEMPSAGVDAIYQRMAAATYARFSNFVFMTIPGPIAVSFFSGSLLLCFAIMFGFSFAGAAFEALAYGLTRNAAVSAVTGVSLAYLVVQLNFPRTLFFYALELIGAVAVLSGLSLIIALDRHATAKRTRCGLRGTDGPAKAD